MISISFKKRVNIYIAVLPGNKSDTENVLSVEIEL